MAWISRPRVLNRLAAQDDYLTRGTTSLVLRLGIGGTTDHGPSLEALYAGKQ